MIGAADCSRDLRVQPQLKTTLCQADSSRQLCCSQVSPAVHRNTMWWAQLRNLSRQKAVSGVNFVSASQNSLKARFCFPQPLESGQNILWITKDCEGLIFKNHKILFLLFFFLFSFLMQPLVRLNLEDLHVHVFLALIVSSGTFLTCSSSFLYFSAKLMTSCLTLANLLGSPANKCGVRRAHDSSLSY